MVIPWQADVNMELNIEERYKPIPDFPDYYITDHGNVYSYRNGNTGWKGLRKLSLRGKNNPRRYLQVCLSKNGHTKYVQVHRLVAFSFCEGYFPGAVVNHIDGNIHNNHYSNLEWVTQKENVHKSYISSGVTQVRNFSIYELLAPDQTLIREFIGRNKAADYIRENDLPISPSSICKYGRSNGYQLVPKQ